jgi:hypothetical protein
MLYRVSNSLATDPAQTIVRAELSGSDRCTALGVTARAYAPVIALCRKLVAAGHDSATPLDAYRGEVLCLQVRSIGEAAGLEINADGTGFRRRRATDTAPPIGKSASAPTRHPARESTTS